MNALRHAGRLARFAAVASAIAFAFAFNLAAMYAEVVYHLLPATRVTGAPPQHWVGRQVGVGSLNGLGPIELLVIALCGLGVLYCIVRGPRTPATEGSPK